MQLTITGYSTALFSTWYFVEEMGLLLDAGDGVTSGLLQKSGKIKHVFISHADRDHLTGLLQLNQLNARPGLPVIYYPRDSGSFPRLEEFSKKFDPHVSGTVWQAMTDKEEINLKDDLILVPIRNEHVPVAESILKSFSCQVFQTKRKLKPEFQKLSGEDIRRIVEEKGREFTTEEVRVPVLSYSGDTPVTDANRWNHSNILIHEATFLNEKEGIREKAHGNKHSTLEEVMEMVSGISIQKLILGHFSSRYPQEQIEQRIKELCEKYAITIPVYGVYPGQICRDILSTPPING